ncbi:MAG TPA: 5'-3' exonuclease H3TH domain-containing protein, partial [Woeseiaceae bacterium]|nr:5'-3' exonuclease H3TH domain-containing protein [Woeseiaceae bacterium]
MSKPRLVLVDGSSYLYRAFHALPPLSTSKGEPTGAVHGVLNMLNKLVREHAGDHIAIVFDAPGRTFRDEMFEEYKANRPPMPDDLRAQIQPVLDAVPAMGLPLLRIDGVEADDVIGTLSRRAVEQGFEVLISTGDKDMAQLVDDHVTIVNTMTGSVLDRNGVKEKFDVFPEQIVDYLALVGDSSDNIPGVPRVGAKTAAKWLNEYGTADAIVADAGQIAGKVGESLRDNLDQLRLSKQLATILQDVELPVEPKELKVGQPDLATLKSLYVRYELKSLLRALANDPGTPAETVAPPAKAEKGRFETVLTKPVFDQWRKRMLEADLVAIDTETNSLNYMQAELVGISVAVTPGEAAYIPLAHDYPGAPAQLGRDEVLASLRDFLEDPRRAKLGHHLKYDAHIFARYGIMLCGMRFDSMLESYVLNSVATRHDMDSTAAHYLGVQTI